MRAVLGKNSEAAYGIVGSSTDQHSAPYALTEEFTAVYRLHPLIPDNLKVRTLTEGDQNRIGDVIKKFGADDFDERVKAITFTGSGPVGWKLAERAAKKKVNLELGNATPVIITADADIDAAAQAMAANAFSFAGQSCISVQRIYIERAAYDSFLEGFIPRVEALNVGDPADEETDVGPVIDADAQERILDWIEEARNGGAKVLTGGETEGELIRPTVIANAAPELNVSCEEVFGPVCTVTAFDSLDEAFELANGTRFVRIWCAPGAFRLTTALTWL